MMKWSDIEEGKLYEFKPIYDSHPYPIIILKKNWHGDTYSTLRIKDPLTNRVVTQTDAVWHIEQGHYTLMKRKLSELLSVWPTEELSALCNSMGISRQRYNHKDSMIKAVIKVMNERRVA